MNVGELSELKIEPRLAYGKKGLPPAVPPDTTVQFNVELLSVEPDIEIESIGIKERRQIG